MLRSVEIPAMQATLPRTVKLDIASRFEMLDVVQTVLNHLATLVGFKEDDVHFMSVAVRESVVNAIKHGNKMDESKRVGVEFSLGPASIDVEVADEGKGFNPESVANPVAQENLLKADGRGIFFMRSFMDTVSYTFPNGHGTVVRMTKKLP
jgi:serine/threonine-protein kinase RsbW